MFQIGRAQDQWPPIKYPSAAFLLSEKAITIIGL